MALLAKLKSFIFEYKLLDREASYSVAETQVNGWMYEGMGGCMEIHIDAMGVWTLLQVTTIQWSKQRSDNYRF